MDGAPLHASAPPSDEPVVVAAPPVWALVVSCAIGPPHAASTKPNNSAARRSISGEPIASAYACSVVGLKARVLVCVAFGTFSSCLQPTEIIIELSTDVACSDVAQNGVAVAVGEPGNDSNDVAASTMNCVDGGIGLLVVVPSGAGPAVGIRVTLGVDASVEDCNEGNGFAGCIVARRALLYVPHHPLTLPIELQAACLGKVCDPSSTCFNGTCVDAGVTCANDTCTLPDAGAPPFSCTTPSVIETAANPMTPHIAKMPQGGYVVTWASGGQLYGTTLSQSGVASSATMTLYPNTGGWTPGPVGTDGTTLYTFVDSSGNLFLASAPLGGVESFGSVAGVGPLAGVLATDAGYVSFFGNEPGGNPPMRNEIYQLPLPAPSVMPLGGPDAGAQPTGFGLAVSGGTYFASFAGNGSCQVLSCDAAFDCAQTILTEPSCSLVRFAPSADPDAWAATVSDAFNAVLIVGRTSTSARTRTVLAAAPDDPEAFIPITTKTAFVGLYRAGDELRATAATPAIDSMMYRAAGGGVGAGFDAVADDIVGSSQLAIVYWKSDGSSGTKATGNILFTQCTQ